MDYSISEPSMGRWPDLSQANVGDTLYYCYRCPYQNNVTQEGTGPSCCKQCGKISLHVWKVEAGEKERQVEWYGTRP